jgi:hypothetical protein
MTYHLSELKTMLTALLQELFGPDAGAQKIQNYNRFAVSRGGLYWYGALTLNNVITVKEQGLEALIELLHTPTLIRKICSECKQEHFVQNTEKQRF